MTTLEEFMEIFRLKGQGLSISAISREAGLDRKTVRKYLKQGKSKVPEMKKRVLRSSKLSCFEPEITSLLRGPEKEWSPMSAPFVDEILNVHLRKL